MNLNKIIGYLLLIIGLIVIGFTLFQSYNIFTDKVSAPLIFKTPTTVQTSQKSNTLDLQAQIQEQMDEAIKKQIGELLPLGAVSKVLNLISWSMLAGILILSGGQIAGLGIKLIR